MKIISCVNQKGGVGKTTATLNLGAAFAKLGQRTLLIDLDTQKNLSNSLRYEQCGKPTLSELIYSEIAHVEYSPADFIQTSETERLDYIPASNMLSAASDIIKTSPDSQAVLTNILHKAHFEEYDIIMIDCKPALDMLTLNALVAKLISGLRLRRSSEPVILPSKYWASCSPA